MHAKTNTQMSLTNKSNKHMLTVKLTYFGLHLYQTSSDEFNSSSSYKYVEISPLFIYGHFHKKLLQKLLKSCSKVARKLEKLYIIKSTLKIEQVQSILLSE